MGFNSAFKGLNEISDDMVRTKRVLVKMIIYIYIYI